jgi:GNAT superfamily N-acetyltransferase
MNYPVIIRAESAQLTALPLTANRMQDLDTVFQARGCSVARNCYCIYYRVTSREYPPWSDADRANHNREAMVNLARGDTPPGLIGYRDGKPVGWVSLGPRSNFKRLETSPTMRRVDDEPVWSIVCFVVPSQFRKQGVAHELLEAAIEYAERQGARLLEGYPVDRVVAGAPSAPWFGSLTMFSAAGFKEVARNRPSRPIVRLVLPRTKTTTDQKVRG